MQIVEKVEKEFMKDEIPDIAVGDQVEVLNKIIEGDKERIQKFIGVVIAKKGSGTRANITVRRIVQGEGAERIFPIHSPNVDGINVIKSHRIRRAKLYYLRDRKGKETRLKEKFVKPSESAKKKAKIKSAVKKGKAKTKDKASKE